MANTRRMTREYVVALHRYTLCKNEHAAETRRRPPPLLHTPCCDCTLLAQNEVRGTDRGDTRSGKCKDGKQLQYEMIRVGENGQAL